MKRGLWTLEDEASGEAEEVEGMSGKGLRSRKGCQQRVRERAHVRKVILEVETRVEEKRGGCGERENRKKAQGKEVNGGKRDG